MLYGTTLRGHVPSDLAFRSHLGSSLELSCLPELGAVFFAMSGDQQRGVPLQQYVEQKYGEDWIENPEAVRFVEGVMMIDVALMAGHEVPTSIPISMLPGNWMGDLCCWVCGEGDHLSYQCPDKCCWICGYEDHLSYVCPDHDCWICGHRDHWSDHCPDNCCWICGHRDHWSDHCPDNCCWICGDRDHWSYRCPRNMKLPDSLVEAMLDLWYQDLHGEDLLSAYLEDIASMEQRVDNVDELDRSILQLRLEFLRRKAKELAMVLFVMTMFGRSEPVSVLSPDS
jgi:hypothetical protein